ncbi:MAG: polysaccharide pyruvyl transferase family protein, partial [Muribaculaceae bacterium]|nr:polysaccharide pyruvyl transferase family protein [Muribaculaceae bacterium]
LLYLLMRIGILTNSLGHNYGGVLQNWALQQVIKSLGHQSVSIDWRQRNAEWVYFFRAVVSCTLRRCLGHKTEFPHSPYWKNPKFSGLRRFVEHKINITRPLFKNKVIGYAKTNFSIVIVGSDQVWRPLYIRPIEMMFLPYRKRLGMKKIAYAASFGTEKNEFTGEELLTCKKLLNDFDSVSVREKSGVKQCLDYFDYKDAKLVLDPTLLIEKEDYMSLCKDIDPDDVGFVFAYILDSNETLEGKGKALADKLGIPFKLLSADASIVSDDTIENWLAAFRDAKYIVTDSFHGTVFSIIFKKPFATVYNTERGTARIDNLISIFPSISERIIDVNIHELPSEIMDFADITTELIRHKQSSIEFLRSSISGRKK